MHGKVCLINGLKCMSMHTCTCISNNAYIHFNNLYASRAREHDIAYFNNACFHIIMHDEQLYMYYLPSEACPSRL